MPQMIENFSSEEQVLVTVKRTDGAGEPIKKMLRRGETLTFGRAPKNDIIVDAPGVSRQHFQVSWQEDEPTLSDLGSLNGTILNRQRVNTPTFVRPGDVIHVSDATVELEVTEEDIEESPGITQQTKEAPSFSLSVTKEQDVDRNKLRRSTEHGDSKFDLPVHTKKKRPTLGEILVFFAFGSVLGALSVFIYTAFFSA